MINTKEKQEYHKGCGGLIQEFCNCSGQISYYCIKCKKRVNEMEIELR
jgi:hypothetical protein